MNAGAHLPAFGRLAAFWRRRRRVQEAVAKADRARLPMLHSLGTAALYDIGLHDGDLVSVRAGGFKRDPTRRPR